MVRAFIIRRLDPKARWRILSGLALLAYGLASFIYAHARLGDFPKQVSPQSASSHAGTLGLATHNIVVLGGVIAFVLSIFSLGKDLFSLLRELAVVGSEQAQPNVTFDSVYAEIRATILSDETPGFAIEKLSNADLISRSDLVDCRLFGGAPFGIDLGREPSYHFLENTPSDVLAGLSLRLMDRATASKDAYFFNETKVSLQTDPSDSDQTVRIAPTTYFATQISNYACKFVGYDDKTRLEYDLSTLFPCHKGQLLSLARSTLSNQIGVSTLCVDQDGLPFVCVQGAKVFSNPDTLAPSGSGSMDWADYKRLTRGGLKPDLISVVIAATKREFGEENRLTEAEWNALEVLPIGYFRYVENGGLPEFISISRIPQPFKNMRPELRELESIPQLYKPLRSAAGVLALCAEIDAQCAPVLPPGARQRKSNNPREKNVSLPLRALCTRLASIVRGELGADARDSVLAFWKLAP